MQSLSLLQTRIERPACCRPPCGRFVPQKFEDLFSKFDKGNKGALSFSDIADMVRANRNIMDPVGW